MITSSWKPIIERLRTFCEGHAMIPSDVNGNKPFTHGQADIIDIMQTGVYPLMHVTPLSVQFDPRGKALLFNEGPKGLLSRIWQFEQGKCRVLEEKSLLF